MQRILAVIFSWVRRYRAPSTGRRVRRVLALASLAIASIATPQQFAALAQAQEADWIWTSAEAGIPAGTCYLRKTFEMGTPENGEIQITCDDSYELYINGRKVGEGKTWKVLDFYDVTKYLVQGKNVVAVKATNVEAGSAGVAARLIVKSTGNTHVSQSSDTSWKVSNNEIPGWTRSHFDDSSWSAAHSFGLLGKAAPWGDDVRVASGTKTGRFQISREFRIEAVVTPKETGSVAAMTFDEFGNILLANEGGPILIVRDSNRDGIPDKTSVYSDAIKSCQGLLALNGKVYAVGEVDKVAGLYRLSDENKDGKLEDVKLILKFKGQMVEHGPHAPVLGPDGMIYVILGNHTAPDKAPEASSPYHRPYEGDLVQPRYEDSSGHANGIKAPGATVVRCDLDGTFVETFAGGLRNAYDLAFNRQGELFTHDSDMEWDMGLPWYRPTRVSHIAPGAEFGWRSGWALWPDYYHDSLAAVVETGRGSPSGMAFYNHFMYPSRYHDTLFVGDWSRGRILAIKTKNHNGSFTAETEVFAEGKPLNITDLAVGPDGWLYFCTGGRGTEGGVFRIVWKGSVPSTITSLGKGIEAAIRQPQLDSAYARQKIAAVKQQVGDKWGPQLADIAEAKHHRPEHRIRALDLMQLMGPFPESKLLVRLSQDESELVRAKAAYLMGIHADETTGAQLVEMLADKDLAVQRATCEALLRAGYAPPLEKLLPLLASTNRHVGFAARRLLEKMPADTWRDQVVETENIRAFLQAATAMTVVGIDRPMVKAVIARSQKIMEGFVTDQDFLDLLRVLQLTLAADQHKAEDIVELRKKLADEYPSQESRMNRELVRLLAYLKDNTVGERMLEQLGSEINMVEKVHVALHARFFDSWTGPEKLQLLKFFEQARALPGGHSYEGYLETVSRDLFTKLTDEERNEVLARASEWPSSAISVLAKLPENPGDATLAQLRQLDGQMAGVSGEAAERLSLSIVAVLGRSGDEKSMEYLREVFEDRPERRAQIAIGLSQHPQGDNWPLLVRSLPIIDGFYAQEVLSKLASVDRRPEKPEDIRQVILRGIKLGEDGGAMAVALLEKWTSQKLGKADDSLETKIKLWQKWFAQKYPSEPEAKLPVDTTENKWAVEELAAMLASPEASRASAARGEAVFAQAQCVKCHRYGDTGERVGPDLTNVSRRFQKKEIIEAVLFPSHVISDQYASKVVLTADGKTYSGMLSPIGEEKTLVLMSDGKKVTLKNDDIEKVSPSKKSAMPEGLFNNLTLQQIADLFAYLNEPPQTNVTSRPGASSRKR